MFDSGRVEDPVDPVDSSMRWSLFGEAEILTVMLATSPAGSPIKGTKKNVLKAPPFLNGGTCSISPT